MEAVLVMGVETATEAATVGSPVAWREVVVRLVASEVGSPVATVGAWVGLGVMVGTGGGRGASSS